MICPSLRWRLGSVSTPLETKRRIHKMFIPPCSIVPRSVHGPVPSRVLHHIQLSSASAVGASFTFECTGALPTTFPVPEEEWVLEFITQCAFSLLQVTWQELGFLPAHTDTPPQVMVDDDCKGSVFEFLVQIHQCHVSELWYWLSCLLYRQERHWWKWWFCGWWINTLSATG